MMSHLFSSPPDTVGTLNLQKMPFADDGGKTTCILWGRWVEVPCWKEAALRHHNCITGCLKPQHMHHENLPKCFTHGLVSKIPFICIEIDGIVSKWDFKT